MPVVGTNSKKTLFQALNYESFPAYVWIQDDTWHTAYCMYTGRHIEAVLSSETLFSREVMFHSS